MDWCVWMLVLSVRMVGVGARQSSRRIRAEGFVESRIFFVLQPLLAHFLGLPTHSVCSTGESDLISLSQYFFLKHEMKLASRFDIRALSAMRGLCT